MTIDKKGLFYIGTSNITLPVANKASFPDAFKAGSRLSYYASLFNSLEVNSSFYKIPRAKTVARWVTEVPEDFRFTFKMFREVTHNKMMIPNEPLISAFMQMLAYAAPKEGSLLIQFPPSIQYNYRFLQELLLRCQENKDKWDICVEFRHPSWYRSDIYRLLELNRSALVLHDMPRSVTPVQELQVGFMYLRFHGANGDYRGGYEFDILQKYAGKINGWLKQGMRVYAYFNNTLGNAVFDALTLQEMVTGRVTFDL